MKIAMIGSRGLASNYGGIEKVLDEICPRLVALGHQIDVYSRVGLQVNAGKLRSIPVASFGGKHLENITRSANATLRAIGHYDLVHFHAIGPGLLSLLTAGTRQKSVVSIHGLDWRRAKWNWGAKLGLRCAELALINCASGVTVVSRSLDNYYRDRLGIEPCFVPNGMERRPGVPLGSFGRSLGLEPDGYVLFASRLVPEKGCHELLEAFARVPTDKKLVIAGGLGDPDYIAHLRRHADPNRIMFIGHRVEAELAELYSNAYLFVLPSHIEGMSNALLEALAHDRAVLVSDIEENLEVVEENGFQFRVGDVDDLTDQLTRLLADPGAIAEMQKRVSGASYVSWDKIALRYDAFYHELVDAPAASRLPLPSILRAA